MKLIRKAFMGHTMRKVQYIALAGLLLTATGAWGQVPDTTTNGTKRIRIDGEILTSKVVDGDTLLMADLDDISVTSMREFASDAEYRRYLKYRRYASSVYPYAVEAIKIFREVERDTEGLRKGKRKKHAKQLQKDLKVEFTDPLKDLYVRKVKS